MRGATARTPTAFGLTIEKVEIPGLGRALPGWWIPIGPAVEEKLRPRSTEAAPAVVLVCGRSRDAGRLLPLAGSLHRAGFGVLVLHGQSPDASDKSGASSGRATVLSLVDDLRMALHFLGRRPEVDPERIAVVGQAVAGASAIVASSRDLRIRAVVAIGGPEARIGDVAAPLLLVRGGADDTPDPEIAGFLQRALGMAPAPAPAPAPGRPAVAAGRWRRPATRWKWLQGIDYSAWGP